MTARLPCALCRSSPASGTAPGDLPICAACGAALLLPFDGMGGDAE